jgi:hypothetical protein
MTKGHRDLDDRERRPLVPAPALETWSLLLLLTMIAAAMVRMR